MIKFNTAEDMVTYMKAVESGDIDGSSKKNVNMFYCSGKKIKKSQVWQDTAGWNYEIENINIDNHTVVLKRQRDNAVFTEPAGDLVSACKLSVDVKNKKKIPVMA